MKARILKGSLARSGDNVTGVIRFLRDGDEAVLGEYPFSEKMAVIAGMTAEEFEAHAIGKMKATLVAERREALWAKVQAVLMPLEVEG